MALREPLMIKQEWSGAATTLTLEADPGESFLVKGIRAGAMTSQDFTEILIDRMSAGYFYTGDINANHLEQYSLTGVPTNVYEQLVRDGVMKGYPIAEGQKMTLQISSGASVYASLIYEKYDAGDIKNTDQNGTESKEFVFLNYGTNVSAASGTAYTKIDSSRNPGEYPAFPFGAVVPAGREIDILGFLLMSWKDWPGNSNPNFSYLKCSHERDVLWDEDRKGMYVREGMGMLTWGPCRQTPQVYIEYLPQPKTFKAGEELLVEINGASGVTALDVHMAAIEKVRVL